MKKFLQKKPVLLVCALLLFSLGCMGVLAVAKPSNGGNAAAETEVMTEGAVPLAGSEALNMDEIDEATSSNAKKVPLEPGDGNLSGSKEILVDKTTGEILSDLPTPTRTGWTFKGWYTKKVDEIYLNGGDTIGDGVASTLTPNGQILEKLKEQVNGYNWVNLSDAELNEKHHSWLIGSEGVQVQKGSKIGADVTALYAWYTPKTVKVNWKTNGWEGSTGKLESGCSYDGYVYTWDWDDAKWGDRVFEGWSFTRDGEVVLKNGYVYKVGGEYLNFTDKDTIDLYAIWSGGDGRDITGINVDILSDSTHFSGHIGSEWRYYLEYTIQPEDAFKEKLVWSIEPEGAGYFVEQTTDNRTLVAVSAQTAKEKKLTSVTVKATAANGAVGEIEIPLKHDWKRNYTYQPTCQHTGWATDQCRICGIINQPTLPKTDHRFSYTTIPATCTEPAYQVNTCKICGEVVKTQTGEPTGHKWGDEKTVEICGGVAHIHTCLTCGVTESDVDVNNADHLWSAEPVIDQEPTCDKAGSQSYHCLKCNLTKDSEIIPPDPSRHNWTKWFVYEQPKVGVMGAQRRTCGNCGTVETEDISALLPSPEDLADVETEVLPETDSNNGSETSSESSSSGSSSGSGSSGSSSSSGSSGSGSSGSSSSSGSSGSSGGSRGSSGGGGSSRGGSGGGASSAPGGSAPAATGTTPLPIVPTEEIREALPDYVEVGDWTKAEDGSWTFKDENGEVYTNRWAAVYNPYSNTAAADAFDWFRFDETGHLITGWYTDPVDGCTYYMNPLSDGTQGKMMTGWVVIEGKEYYFNPNSDGTRGRMFKNEATPDGHFVGPDGVKIR